MQLRRIKYFILTIALLLISTATIRAHAECANQGQPPSATFLTALSNLNSFQYARRSLAQAKAKLTDPSVCISIVALDKNAYQYFKYFVRIEVMDKASKSPVYGFNYIFQDASVQAFHNFGGQPWDGLDRKVTEEVINNFVGKSRMTRRPAKFSGDALEHAKTSATYINQQSMIDPETLSVTRLLVDSKSNSYFLVSWMSKSANNPFSDKPIVGGVMIAVDNQNNWMMADNVDPYNDLLVPLQNHLDSLQGNMGPPTEWADKMFKLSEHN